MLAAGEKKGVWLAASTPSFLSLARPLALLRAVQTASHRVPLRPNWQPALAASVGRDNSASITPAGKASEVGSRTHPPSPTSPARPNGGRY